MAWINENTGKMYYTGSITIIHNGVLFSGIPTSEQLTEWGFVEYIPPTPPPPPEWSDEQKHQWEDEHPEGEEGELKD